MTNLYLDTNIFIYLSDKKSKFYKPCLEFINYCQENKIDISTSAETIQEIIYLSQNLKQLTQGLKTANAVLKLVDNLYPISEATTQIYLDFVQNYRNRKSRDILHLSSCIENKIEFLITYDEDFKKFKEVNILLPEEVLT